MESRDFALNGATSIEISAFLTYANLTKFMKLPDNNIRNILENPEEISDFVDVLTDAIGEHQAIPPSTPAYEYFFKFGPISYAVDQDGNLNGNIYKNYPNRNGDASTSFLIDTDGKIIDTLNVKAVLVGKYFPYIVLIELPKENIVKDQ